MKITGIEVTPIRVPLKPGMSTKTAHGEHSVSRYAIIRVHTDADIVGLGEATIDPRWSGETVGTVVSTIRDSLEPVLKGTDPREIQTACRLMERALKLNPFTRAAVEMALWDISGKAAGVPVYRMLGGPVMREIPIKMVVGAFDTPRAVQLAKKFLDFGVGCIKVKTGLDPAGDIDRVRAIRELAGPEMPITIDSNCGWSLSAAKYALSQMERYDVIVAEQPIMPGNPEAFAALRRGTRIPIMADESVFTLADAWALVSAGAVDVLSVYPGKQGGIWNCIMTGHVAKAAGIVCHMGSNLELGIGSAAMLHTAAAMESMDSRQFPGDILGPLYHEADMLTKPLELGPKVAKVPDGAGLGVELDQQQLEHYREK